MFLQPTSAVAYYTILYCTILYYTVLYYTILYYTILYYTILYYYYSSSILYYTITIVVVYYTMLYYYYSSSTIVILVSHTNYTKRENMHLCMFHKCISICLCTSAANIFKLSEVAHGDEVLCLSQIYDLVAHVEALRIFPRSLG